MIFCESSDEEQRDYRLRLRQQLMNRGDWEVVKKVELPNLIRGNMAKRLNYDRSLELAWERIRKIHDLHFMSEAEYEKLTEPDTSVIYVDSEGDAERVEEVKKPISTDSDIAARMDKFVDPGRVLDGDPDDPESISGAELDELVARTRDKEVDFEADLRWAYHNMGRRDIRPNDDCIPSFGAWTLLDFAKKNRKQFMETVTKTLSKVVVEQRKNRQDDSMEQFEMLRTFEKGMAKIE